MDRDFLKKERKKMKKPSITITIDQKKLKDELIEFAHKRGFLSVSAMAKVALIEYIRRRPPNNINSYSKIKEILES